MTDDVQKILDAISLSQDYTLALYGDESAVARLTAKADLPESIKKFLVERAKPKVEIPKDALVRENFKSDLEFAKAVIVAEDAKAKISTDAERALVEKVKAELKPELGEALKKSFVQKDSTIPDTAIDFKKLAEKAESGVRFADFMREAS
jgi:fatty acid/phospholipid biosynthesis enzyme